MGVIVTGAAGVFGRWISAAFAREGARLCLSDMRLDAIQALASELKLVDKSGAWYSYGGERIGQGRDNARTYLEEHPDMLRDIERKVFEATGLKPRDATPAAAEEKPNTKASAAEGKRARAPS